ncbi:efflux transporter outer membrane subunit [Aliarcobacter butzleri]|jgi:outer membrane protein, multidrug efflux system|uniref:efflux transporter outer membrane subunit n=1 Tax=Aliarcobacter TaxID=2321111 RepID=UPI001EDA9052|nr:efflux transporter outer membrane subunit [Aliarcobacter butzleri]MCG3684588.1 efflux transporter outer membrane subunit [Aliarcobacter butzleri]HRM99201.1 efflux transporter outer membrane subunit [Aliarcobacter cryaerophilus]
MFKFLFILINLFIFTGCSLKPDIEYNDSIIPTEFKNSKDKNSNLEYIQPNWQDFVKNDKLKELIKLAIENNRDLKIAILNIESARATYRIEKAKYFPSIDAKASNTNARDVTSNNNTEISRTYSAKFGASYELDLFGKTRSLNDSTLQSYLATKYAATSAKISLISEVINIWNTLSSNIEHLKLLQNSIDNLEVASELTQKKFDMGIILIDDVFSSQTSLKETEVNLLNQLTTIEKNKNALELLVSTSIPNDLLPTGFKDTENSLMLIQSGLSSEVLFSRPDIIEAEYNLKAKNANIGVARAAFFPSITLTADYGLASTSLSSLFNGNAQTVWSFIPSINLPIFKGGENKANLDYANAQQKIALAQYEKTIQSAFKDVSDALIERANISKQLNAQEDLVNTAQKSYEVALNSYKYGLGTYLNVLVAQKTLFDTQRVLVDTKLNELINRVSLYTSLGGNEKID